MKIKDLHPWKVTYKEAIALQKRLKTQIVLEQGSNLKTFNLMAGADVSYSKKSKRFYAGVIIFSFPNLLKIEEATAEGEVEFPYIPGLLSFREAPILLEAFKKIKNVPDLAIFDGQGIAHPRGLGLASHLGLFLDLPTIGCAKTPLVGEYQEVGGEKGDYSLLRKGEKIVGVGLRTRTGTKPLFVSPGNRIDWQESKRIVLECLRNYRLPEPLRQAHLLVNKIRIQKNRA